MNNMEEGGKIIPTESKQAALIESVKRLNPEERIAKLVEFGILIDLEGYTWGSYQPSARVSYVFANVKGIPVPMYRTSKHTDKKRADLNFFAFFGIQHARFTGFPWLIKGSSKDANDFYGIPELGDASRILTETLDFDIYQFAPKDKQVLTGEKLNALLSKRFGIDFDEIDTMPTNSSPVIEHSLDKILEEISKKNP